MRKVTALLILLIPQVFAVYNLNKLYVGADIYSEANWRYWTDRDLNAGNWNATDYIGFTEASNWGMLSTKNVNGKTHTVIKTATGKTNNKFRRSVRMTSKDYWETPGAGTLFMMDLSHMPEGCSTWPSWWLTQNLPVDPPQWPKGGEIDVIEGANTMTNNRMSLHTRARYDDGSCDMWNMVGKENGVLFNGTWANYPNQMVCDDGGCAIDEKNPKTFGAAFNSNPDGGTFAMEWKEESIKIWFLPRSVYSGRDANPNPNPSCWPMPAAYFDMSSTSHCYPSSKFFFGQRMVIQTAFCGTWAGNQFGYDCPAYTGSCMDYISTHHSLLDATAHWEIESISVYINDGTALGSCSAPTTKPTTKPTPSPTTKPTPGPTTKPTTAPTPSPSPLAQNYVGCLVDSATRDLPNHCPDNPTSLTNEKCRYFCGVRGFTYAGTQNGYQCWCGNNAGQQGIAPETDCSVACPGNGAQKCGGGYRNSVYYAGKAGYMGCFQDSMTARVLPYQAYSGSNNHVDECRKACATAGYAYAGLQYGSECWCGNNYNTLGSAPESECNVPCSGDNTFMCGAGNRNSVYTAQLPAGYAYY